MKKSLLCCFLVFFVLLGSGMLFSQDMSLQYVSTYHTGVFDEGAAEIAAYDAANARLFFTNADANTVQVLDIADPNNPMLLNTIQMDTYGDGVNSVDVFGNLVALAVEVEDAQGQQPGKVVFFNTEGVFQAEVQVGALPDMVTFTNDGAKVLTANEGEPNDDYDFDPEGSVSIIDLAGGPANAAVTTVGFTAFNGQKMSLINRGIRIFGPDATVAQDLEPEFITVTPDNQFAYVSLQENNALAVIDLNSEALVELLPLGYKDHLRGSPSLEELLINEQIDLPALGTPTYDGGQPTIFLGGFSGLYFDPTESDENNYVFYTIPDRGPNASQVDQENAVQATNGQPVWAALRPFKLPSYQARIIKLNVDPSTNTVTQIDSILLGRMQNDQVVPITGVSNIDTGFDETTGDLLAVDEIPVTFVDSSTQFRNAEYRDTVNNVDYAALNPDPFGGDMEGILRDENGDFWLCDEYRPSIYHFSADGMMINRFVPDNTSQLSALPLGEGTYGSETLPEVYSKRRVNRGFEAIAYDPDSSIIYAFMQSPMDNPSSEATRNKSDVIRILGIRPDGTPVREYVYLLENNRNYNGFGQGRVDKIGDAVYLGNGRFMVLERDSSTPDDGNTGKKYVFEISLEGATNILGTELSAKMDTTGANDKTLEMMTADDLAAAGIQPVNKTKLLNLPSLGYLPSDKAEGLALLPDGGLAVLNDNDFGLAGAGITDNSALGIIRFNDDYGFDASGDDGGINIIPRPTLGMFQPDAISSFSVDGQNFLISANEGDAREYEGTPGFIEETDVEDIFLDPNDFDDVNDLQADANLGGLAITNNTRGDIDGDGLFDRLFSYGARSFSIWDQFGNLVFDSGDDFEQITAERFPADFNTDNDENDPEGRSDNKGPEPEAVTVAALEGELYAFVGLERIGGVMVYNVSNPAAPQFVQYINNRDFSANVETMAAGDLGVEDIVFIPMDQSPVSKPLVVTANEVSGTVSIFSIGEFVDVEDVQDPVSTWRVFPNPVSEVLFTNQVSDYEVFTTLGQRMLTAQNTNRINLANLPTGAYIVKDVRTNRSKMVTKR